MAIDQSSAQIIVTDYNGKIEYVNQRFTEVTGYSSEDIIEKNAFNISPNNINLGYSSQIIEDLKKGNVFRAKY